MKFLHEFLHYGNGTVIDNGYWEIDGDYLYNFAGGRHHYTPSPNDEIIESDWAEVRRLNAKAAISDNHTTGWIAPDGTFYGVSYQDHHLVAEYLGMTEGEMENSGYVKIYFNPIWPDHGNKYEYWFKDHLSGAQIETLTKRGFSV